MKRRTFLAAGTTLGFAAAAAAAAVPGPARAAEGERHAHAVHAQEAQGPDSPGG